MRRSGKLGLVVLGAFGALGLFAFLGGRGAGRERLGEVLVRHGAEGLGASLDDLVAGAPAVDADLQERAWEWLQGPRDSGAGSSSGKDWTWYLAGETAPPDEVREWFDGFRDDAARLADLLRTGRLRLTSTGWLAVDRRRLSETPVANRSVRLPDLLRLRDAQRWWQVASLLEQGRGESLDALDHLKEALDPCHCLLDVIVSSLCEEQRDETYLLLAAKGDLPTERLVSWADEPPRATERHADAWRGERLLWWASVARDLVAGGSIEGHFPRSSGGESLGDVARRWQREIFASDPVLDCALHLEGIAALERWLRGTGSAAAFREASAKTADAGWPFQDSSRAWNGSVELLVARRLAHRAVRAAALVVADASPPSDAVAARARLGRHATLLDAGPWDVALRYETTPDGGLRFVADPASPLPDLLTPEDLDDLDCEQCLAPLRFLRRAPPAEVGPAK